MNAELRETPGAPASPSGAATPHAPARERDAGHTAPRRYVCRACGAHVANVGDELAVDGRAHHERVNPGVFVHRFVTVSRALGVRAVGAPTAEFTWFVGYAWQIADCAACGVHLGWRFASAGERVPAAFYGLRLDQVREQGDDEPAGP